MLNRLKWLLDSDGGRTFVGAVAGLVLALSSLMLNPRLRLMAMLGLFAGTWCSIGIALAVSVPEIRVDVDSFLPIDQDPTGPAQDQPRQRVKVIPRGLGQIAFCIWAIWTPIMVIVLMKNMSALGLQAPPVAKEEEMRC